MLKAYIDITWLLHTIAAKNTHPKIETSLEKFTTSTKQLDRYTSMNETSFCRIWQIDTLLSMNALG